MKGKYESDARDTVNAAPNLEGPLCVDLDGTLIRTDLLWESAVLLLRDKPWFIASMILWISHGRAALKREIAVRVNMKPALLPYNSEVIDWLRQQKRMGRRIVLATASDLSLAVAVAEHVKLFDELIASDGITNMKGASKLAELERRYGRNFAYVGDARADLPIWTNCSEAILVNPSRTTEAAARRAAPVSFVFRNNGSKPRLLLRALRVHQWVKNLLVFVPLISSHQIDSVPLLHRATLTFISFSFCASSIYLINDLADIDSDRQHIKKRHRPFASGELSLWHGIALIPVMLTSSFLLAAGISSQLTAVLSLYLASTILYSFWLKKKLLIDVFTLASLYTLRIVAGGAACAISISSWLLAFSVFIFLSLGFCKRVAEMTNLAKSGQTELAGRAYTLMDLPQVNIFGVASGFIASLVLALYMSSDNVKVLYRNQAYLWVVCPLMLYWLSRIWLLTSRGLMNEDPIVFAATDRVTYMIAFLVLTVMCVASRF